MLSIARMRNLSHKPVLRNSLDCRSCTWRSEFARARNSIRKTLPRLRWTKCILSFTFSSPGRKIGFKSVAPWFSEELFLTLCNFSIIAETALDARMRLSKTFSATCLHPTIPTREGVYEHLAPWGTKVLAVSSPCLRPTFWFSVFV